MTRGQHEALVIDVVYDADPARIDDPRGPRRAQPDAAWTYRHPYPWVQKIRDHVAFWKGVEVDQ